MPYEFFPHTGDIGIRVRGASLEALLRSAVHAFTDALVDLDAVREVDRVDVTCEAAAPDLLLHDLLSELLYLFDAKGRPVRDADVVGVVHGAGISRTVAQLRPIGVIKG